MRDNASIRGREAMRAKGSLVLLKVCEWNDGHRPQIESDNNAYVLDTVEQCISAREHVNKRDITHIRVEWCEDYITDNREEPWFVVVRLNEFNTKIFRNAHCPDEHNRNIHCGLARDERRLR